jgi:hypothetical protein
VEQQQALIISALKILHSRPLPQMALHHTNGIWAQTQPMAVITQALYSLLLVWLLTLLPLAQVGLFLLTGIIPAIPFIYLALVAVAAGVDQPLEVVLEVAAAVVAVIYNLPTRRYREQFLIQSELAVLLALRLAALVALVEQHLGILAQQPLAAVAVVLQRQLRHLWVVLVALALPSTEVQAALALQTLEQLIQAVVVVQALVAQMA